MRPDDVSPAEVLARTQLVEAVLGADEVMAEHLSTFDEMLPHLLMADMRRFFVALVEAEDDERASSLVRAIERLAASDNARVRNIVEVSFIEDLVLGDDNNERRAREALRAAMGPATARSLAVSKRAYPA